jgi:nucleotide-binding universal stress UspA family protein
VRAVSPPDYAYAYGGRARELLAKAEAAARAFGVPCESKHVVHDQPATAIVEAARSTACDLIFMARTAAAASSAWRSPRKPSAC